MLYNKSEAIEASKEFLKELQVLEEKYGVSFNSDTGDVYLTYKTNEDGKFWGNIKIGWEGNGTGLKVMEPEPIEMYEFKMFKINGEVSSFKVSCNDDFHAMRVSMALADTKDVTEIKFDKVKSDD